MGLLFTLKILSNLYKFSSVAQSYLTFRLHGLQHTRPPCPSPTSGVYSNSCPLSQWCHPAISSSVFSFSSHLQSFPASGSFPMKNKNPLFFTSGGQNTGVSTSASVLPMNAQDWFPLRLTVWISLQSKGLSRVFSNTLCDPMDCRPPGASGHGILHGRILEQVAMLSSRRSCQPRDLTDVSWVSCIGTWVLYH